MLQSWLQPGHNKKNKTPGCSDGNKCLISFIYLFWPHHWQQEKKLLQLLHHLKMGFWEKIIQSKTFENTHVSPWANF